MQQIEIAKPSLMFTGDLYIGLSNIQICGTVTLDITRLNCRNKEDKIGNMMSSISKHIENILMTCGANNLEHDWVRVT